MEKTSQEEGTSWKANGPPRSDCEVRAASPVTPAELLFPLFWNSGCHSDPILRFLCGNQLTASQGPGFSESAPKPQLDHPSP